MDANDVAGTVAAVWRFPVKSMLGEQLDAGEVTPGGIVGDRAYALVDAETGKVVSAKHPKKWPDVLQCRATFVEQPVAGEEPPPVRIELPDGTSVRSDAPDADAVLSRFFGRDVRLASAAQNGYEIEQYHPDLDYDPEHRDELVDVKLGAAFFDERGLPSVVPEGSFFDLFPFTVMTTSTLDRLGELQPGSDFDARRFRMNVIVDTPGSGFVENDWVGRRLAVGGDVSFTIAMPDPRCVMPSLAQPGLERDGEVLRTIAKHNRLEMPGGNEYPCAGVYALSRSSGTIRAGDEVTLA
ncbi:MAG TPA: MOSC N-terminal beta barrel domain-containing protein [Solirubrobacteraceae bacterium]|nr:MOSC N-terminal beta barrel domain-containing protein [Solirubrobacteraceae bacterium]